MTSRQFFPRNRQLKSLIVHNTTTTRSRLTLTAREHYERELKQQAFLMLGSLEAFGNPVGLVRGMGQVGTIPPSLLPPAHCDTLSSN